VATLLADESSVEMRRHGPELSAQNAIGTPDYCLAHRNSWIRRRSKKTGVQSRAFVTAAFTARW